MYENRHDLTQGQPSLALADLEEMARIHGGKPLAEIVNIAEHSDELQLVHRNPLVVWLIRG
jgi:hypothetical protein